MTETTQGSPGINGWAGAIVILLVAVIAVLGGGLWVHVDLTTREHREIAESFKGFGCIVALQDYEDKQHAALVADPCKYLREVGQGRRGPR